MFYVNSETFLNTDPFFSLYRGELSTSADKTIYQLPMNILYNFVIFIQPILIFLI